MCNATIQCLDAHSQSYLLAFADNLHWNFSCNYGHFSFQQHNNITAELRLHSKSLQTMSNIKGAESILSITSISGSLKTWLISSFYASMPTLTV